MKIDTIRDHKICNALIFHLFLMLCKNMLVSTSNYFYSINSTLNMVCFVLIGLVYLYVFFRCDLLSKIKKETFLILFLVFLFLFITFLCDPVRFTSNEYQYKYVGIQARTFFSYCLPLFILLSTIDDFDYLLKKLCKYIYVVFFTAIISLYFVYSDSLNSYSMSYGYAVLFPSVVLLYKFTKDKKILDLIAFIICCASIFIAGSRGPLVCILCSIIFYIFRGKLTLKKILILFLLLFLTIFVALNFTSILSFINDILGKIGIKSRTIEMVLMGNVSSTESRVKYHNGILQALMSGGWVIGLGAFGGEATVGLTHGLFLDVWANFGVIFGSVLLLYLFGRIIQIIITSTYIAFNDLLIIICLIGLPIGFFDSEFWSSKELWMIFALFINFRHMKKQLKGSAINESH